MISACVLRLGIACLTPSGTCYIRVDVEYLLLVAAGLLTLWMIYRFLLWIWRTLCAHKGTVFSCIIFVVLVMFACAIFNEDEGSYDDVASSSYPSTSYRGQESDEHYGIHEIPGVSSDQVATSYDSSGSYSSSDASYYQTEGSSSRSVDYADRWTRHMPQSAPPSSVSVSSIKETYGSGGYGYRPGSLATIVDREGNVSHSYQATPPQGTVPVVVHTGRPDNGSAWGKHVEYRPQTNTEAYGDLAGALVKPAIGWGSEAVEAYSNGDYMEAAEFAAGAAAAAAGAIYCVKKLVEEIKE